MVQFENEYLGRDFTANVKAINPSVLDGGMTGIFMSSYLQAVTPSLSLGLETMWSRAAMNMSPESAVSYVGRYRGSDWVGSVQLTAQGAINTSYWRRLTDKVEVGSDLNLQFAPGLSSQGGLLGGLRKDGSATLGAKYSFRASIFRAQVDSSGKLGALLEKQVLPFVHCSFAGELDHVKVSFRSHIPSSKSTN